MRSRLLFYVAAVVICVLPLAALAPYVFGAGCSYAQPNNQACDWAGCNLTVSFCAGATQANCPITVQNEITTGPFVCTFSSQKENCVGAVDANGKTLYKTCTTTTKCVWDNTQMACLATGNVSTCVAPYFVASNC